MVDGQREPGDEKVQGTEQGGYDADGGGGSDSREDEVSGLVDEIPEVDVKDGESILETAEKALKAVKNKSSGRKGKATEEKTEEESPKLEGSEDKQQEEEPKKELDEELLPPEGLSQSEKDEFLKMKYGPRRAFNRMWRRGVGEIQSKFREIAQKEREHSGIYDAIYPYRDSIPEGHTVPSMIGALMKVHSSIADKDENKAFSEVILIGERRFGQNFRARLEAYLDGKENFSPPQQNTASQGIDPALLSRLDRLEQEHIRRESAPIAREFESVANERDQFGNFVFPELQNPDFVSWLNDKVIAVKRENPALSWGDSMKQAWSRATGRAVPVSTRPNATSHQANSSNTSRALSAAATTRGRTSSEVIDDEEPPEWATKSIQATAEWALQRERKRLRG